MTYDVKNVFLWLKLSWWLDYDQVWSWKEESEPGLFVSVIHYFAISKILQYPYLCTSSLGMQKLYKPSQRNGNGNQQPATAQCGASNKEQK